MARIPKHVPRYSTRVLDCLALIRDLLDVIDGLDEKQARSLGNALERIYAFTNVSEDIEPPLHDCWTLADSAATEGIRSALHDKTAYEWKTKGEIKEDVNR